MSPRRKPISNVSNLKEGFYHRSYALCKKDLNGLRFDSQSLREWVCQEREKKKGGLLMHVSIPTTYISLVFCMFFLFLCSFSSFFLPLLPFIFSPFPPLFSLFTTTLFYTICHGGIYHFYPSIAFGSLWVSFQDCLLACWLLSLSRPKFVEHEFRYMTSLLNLYNLLNTINPKKIKTPK